MRHYSVVGGSCDVYVYGIARHITAVMNAVLGVTVFVEVDNGFHVLSHVCVYVCVCECVVCLFVRMDGC